MDKSVLIAGGGIAGLACALSLSRVGWQASVCERAPVFSEVGAGVQLGPNVTRVLIDWGLEKALMQTAVQPLALDARGWSSGRIVASLPLADMRQRYGAPFVTLHRADLHALLLTAAQSAGAHLRTDTQVLNMHDRDDGIEVLDSQQRSPSRHALAVVADGVWSQLRKTEREDTAPFFTGHVAYRALVAQSSLPAALRSRHVTVWMGPQAHVVHYPVKGGEWLNVVCLLEDVNGLFASQGLGSHGAPSSQLWQQLQTWNTNNTREGTHQAFKHALKGAAPALKDLVDACLSWRAWPLCARVPLQGAYDMARGRKALVGDAAHPMLPYVAQGAGMAIEDAAVLGRVMIDVTSAHVVERLRQFAQVRWQRNARVQACAIRNGKIFHSTGPVRWARDAALTLLGARLMDLPWLYSYNAGKL